MRECPACLDHTSADMCCGTLTRPIGDAGAGVHCQSCHRPLKRNDRHQCAPCLRIEAAVLWEKYTSEDATSPS